MELKNKLNEWVCIIKLQFIQIYLVRVLIGGRYFLKEKESGAIYFDTDPFCDGNEKIIYTEKHY